MELREQLNELVIPIRDDLTSGAAEIALRAINVFQAVMTGSDQLSPEELKQRLVLAARALRDAQPAMAPLFHLGNTVLLAVRDAQTSDEVYTRANEALTGFEKRLCDTAAKIADLVFDLIPHGQLLFAYSFSSTVVSSLLNAKARGRFFRVVCTEARPSMEGRKLASTLSSAGIEVINTFDCALGMVLSECRAAFMGVDCVGRPGVVNKVGSWMLAAACKELGIPLYALTGTEKFVTDERLFEFEKHERPGAEVWPEAPKGVQVLNQQYELIPLSMVTGIVTERGILREPDVGHYVSKLDVHDALKLESGSIA